MKKMKKRYFVFVAVAVVVAVLVVVNLKAREKRALAVQTEEVAKRDITMVISASGSVRPKRKVDISASSIGKVTRVAVKEGETVQKGQFLLQIDPVELETTVTRIRAMLAWVKPSRPGRMEKMWTANPSCSSSRISLEMKVSEIRGYPFRTIPNTGRTAAVMTCGPGTPGCAVSWSRCR